MVVRADLLFSGPAPPTFSTQWVDSLDCHEASTGPDQVQFRTAETERHRGSRQRRRRCVPVGHEPGGLEVDDGETGRPVSDVLHGGHPRKGCRAVHAHRDVVARCRPGKPSDRLSLQLQLATGGRTPLRRPLRPASRIFAAKSSPSPARAQLIVPSAAHPCRPSELVALY